MGGKDSMNATANLVQRRGEIGSEKAVGHPSVLEEPPGDVEIEVARVITPVDEEQDGEHRLAVGGVVPRGDEAELWVGSDGVLDALECKFYRSSKVI